MKIAFIRKKYTPFGGAEKYVSSLITNLLKEGHEIHIFAHSWDKNYKNEVVYHHVPIIRGASFLSVLSFAFFAKRLLKKYQFDIIHSFERTIYQDIYRAGDGCHKEWLIQKKKRATAFDNLTALCNPLHCAILAIEKLIFKKGNYKIIIANSQRGKEEIMRHYDVPDEKIEVIYNGVDLFKYSPENRKLFRDTTRRSMGINKNDILVMFTGSGFKRKGLKYLLYAIERLTNQIKNIPVQLLIIGRGHFRKYEAIIKKLNVSEKVKFLGPCADMQKLYSSADIFVLPSLYEPFSNACCEAMASGLPVITSKINGISELIQEGENGFILNDPANPVEIAEKIKALLTFKERNRIGNKARRTIEKYNIESQTAKTIAVYEKVMKKKVFLNENRNV